MRVYPRGLVIAMAWLGTACGSDTVDMSANSPLPTQGIPPMVGGVGGMQDISSPTGMAPAGVGVAGNAAPPIAPSPVINAPAGMGLPPMPAPPVGTDPVGTDPVGTDPMGTDPMGTDPMGTDPMGTDPMGPDPMGMANGAQALPPTMDYAAPGPFKTTSEMNTGPGRNYAIFRPEPMGENGFLHSPIIFGPGILTSPSMYESLFDHLSSHGFVTICVNSLGGGPGAPANVQAMKEGLDWLIAQNSESGVFQGKLAVDRAIAMGYSLGATASVQLSSHEAVATTVAIHGHGTSGDPHGPVLLLTGTDDVIASVRQTQGTLEEAPAVLMALPIGHLDVLAELAMLTQISSSARYIAPITAWLRYWINGDEDAKRFFWGADCEMCSTPWSKPETNSAWEALAL